MSLVDHRPRRQVALEDPGQELFLHDAAGGDGLVLVEIVGRHRLADEPFVAAVPAYHPERGKLGKDRTDRRAAGVQSACEFRLRAKRLARLHPCKMIEEFVALGFEKVLVTRHRDPLRRCISEKV